MYMKYDIKTHTEHVVTAAEPQMFYKMDIGHWVGLLDRAVG